MPESVAFAAIAILTVWLPGHFAAAYRSRRKAAGVEPIPVPPSKEADARNRAGRTFWQGLLIDVAVALVVTLGPMLVGSDFAFTTTYWQTLGVLAGKTVIAAAVSYLMRKLVPPQFEPAREVKAAQPSKIAAFEVPPDEPDTDPLPGPFRWEGKTKT